MYRHPTCLVQPYITRNYMLIVWRTGDFLVRIIGERLGQGPMVDFFSSWSCMSHSRPGWSEGNSLSKRGS